MQAITLASVALAQTPPTTIVRWQSGAPNSALIVRNGLEIVMLDHEGLSVRAILRITNDKPQVFLAILNGSPNRIDLAPSLVTFKLVAPKEKAFPYLDPDQVAAEIRNEATAPAMVGFMLGAHASSTVGEAGRAGFHSTTTDSGLVATTHRENQKADSIQARGHRKSALVPGDGVGGVVFFDNPKHYAKDYRTGRLDAILTVLVEDYLFEFPFWWDGKLTTKCQKGLLGSCHYTFGVPLSWKAKSER